MTKWILFPFFIFIISHTVVAQESGSNSSSLQSSSQSILQREINFYHAEGKLKDALLKLSIEQNIKFSYSDDKIQNTTVKEVNYSSVELASVLSALLRNTGFTYLVIGRIVVIVEEEKVTSAEKLPSDTPRMPSDIPSTSSDSSTGSSTSVNVYHIYSPDANLSKLPAKERKKIQQLYKKEMEWASHHKKPSPGFSKDSLSRAGSAALPQEKLNRSLNDFQYYVSGKLGLMKYLPRITDNSNLSWEQELNYKYEIKNSFYPAIGFGFIVNHFMIGTGIAYHQLSIKGEGRAIYPKGKSGKADTATVSFSDSYSVVPIPLEVSFFQQRKSFFIGAGLKFELDFIHFKGVKSNRFESYYLLKEKDGVYYEKYNKLAAVGSLNILAGVVFQKKMILASGVEYNYCISPFSENTLYNFYPSSLLFKVSFFYFLSKYDFKRNVMK